MKNAVNEIYVFVRYLKNVFFSFCLCDRNQPTHLVAHNTASFSSFYDTSVFFNLEDYSKSYVANSPTGCALLFLVTFCVSSLLILGFYEVCFFQKKKCQQINEATKIMFLGSPFSANVFNRFLKTVIYIDRDSKFKIFKYNFILKAEVSI